MQVSAEDLTSGEDRTLRSRLRQLEARRYSIERAGLVHSALSGDGGVGGLDDMLRTVRGHLQAIAEQEQAYSAMAGQLSSPCRDVVSTVVAIPQVAERRVVCPRGWQVCSQTGGSAAIQGDWRLLCTLQRHGNSFPGLPCCCERTREVSAPRHGSG